MITSPKPDDAKSPEELFTQVDEYLVNMHALLDRREFSEMQGLDKFVEYLCGRIMKLSQDEALRYAPQLDALMESMNVLQARLEEAKSHVRDELNSLNKQTAAAKAYRPKEG